MEYVASVNEQAGFIACCECGVLIEPNPSNMCVGCLRSKEDITQGIPKQAVLYFCRNCERYLQHPVTWIPAQHESRELLAVCLKKLKGLSKVRLVDDSFVWTEPHSMRIKVKLTIQKEVSGAVLQQVFVVELMAHNYMCDDCHRVEVNDYWKAVVQIRQKETPTNESVSTLKYMDQTIHESLRLHPPMPLTNRMASETVTIKGLTIPKGFGVTVPIYEVMMDPEYFPDPDHFDPDRFKATAGMDPITFMAFGFGPRMCLGMKLAMLEIKITLVHVLRKLQFIRTPELPDTMHYKVGMAHLLTSASPLLIKAVPREDDH